jgi:predicted aconitase
MEAAQYNLHMRLTEVERAVLDGAQGELRREALDYIVQLGEAFDAECLVDISYCHYPAEMAIYPGSVEDALEYAQRSAADPTRPCAAVPTTTSTLCADLERPGSTGCPSELEALQARIEAAHQALGLLPTYTCTPQQLGFIPPTGSFIASVESSAIIYYNSVLGARTNRGGQLTRYSAICGKYPLLGYLRDEQRAGSLLFNIEIAPPRLRTSDAWSALGFHIGALAGSGVPVLCGLPPATQEQLLALGATLATSGAVTLYHIPGQTPEARTVEEAFQGRSPQAVYTVTEADLNHAYDRLRTIPAGAAVDFVTLGCPHYTLAQLSEVAQRLAGRHVADGVRVWICTNRMTRAAASAAGYTQTLEAAGALVVADTCPVESHMRQSTCRQYGLRVPNVMAMVTDSAKMARYVGDLIGCKTALTDRNGCIAAALSGRWL